MFPTPESPMSTDLLLSLAQSAVSMAQSATRPWLALLGGPLAWLGQALLVWYVQRGTCGDIPGSTIGLSPFGMRGIEVGISALALAAAVNSAALGWDLWRRAPRLSLADRRAEADRLWLAAVVVSLAFGLAIAWSGYASWLLPVCSLVQ
jgi:hypothetical protein